MKKIIKIILCVFLLKQSISHNTYAISTNITKTSISPNFKFDQEKFSNYVFRRFYFIKRLKRSIMLFDKINNNIEKDNNSITIQKLFEFDSSINFKHYRIKQSIEQIKKKQNFKPLFTVWQDFASYKSLDDQLFIEEFTKEIFVISKNVFLSTKSNKGFYNAMFLLESLQESTESLLNEIDTLTDKIINRNLSFKIYPTKKNYDIKPLAHINDIIMHFYYIKRLIPSTSIFYFLYNSEYLYKQKITLKKTSTSIDSINFYHHKVTACIKTMNRSSSIKPLLSLLHEVRQYRHIQDEFFMHELLLLIFIVHKNIILNSAKNNLNLTKRSTLATIISISNTIDQLPIAELLNAIDMLVEELPAVLEKYEFHSTMTWKKWLRKYWWVPPVIIGWFGLKILLKFQHKPYLFNQGLYQPKPSPIITTDPVLLELIHNKN